MPIHPIDLQVSIPKSGEVNKVQRTGQDQQQINQHSTDQAVRLSLSAQQQTVQKTFETDRQEIKNDDRSKKRKNGREDEKDKKKDKKEKDAQGGLDIKA
ncbi:MAG: hypothetical protein LBL26_02715 [Peptococcaceae bacterium]|nr:hypothetical protein [Peptococcaceae bacterium]